MVYTFGQMSLMMIRGTLALALTLAAATGLAAQPAPSLNVAAPDTIPAGTRLRFHLTATVSSNESKSGQGFFFVMLEPVVVGGQTVIAAGETGTGTLVLAGRAGTSGHEGDLTLRLDSIPSADHKRLFAFADQRFEYNGRNQKITSAVLGFVPFVGVGSIFIRGANAHIEPSTPLETVLTRPATLVPLPATAPPPAPATTSARVGSQSQP